MAARRGRTQARRSGGGNGLPGWAWLVLGILLTLLLVFVAPRLVGGGGEGGGFFKIGPHANGDAVPKGSAETDGAFDPGSSAKSVATPSGEVRKAAEDKAGEFDFYELLPGEEVAMTDAQIAAIAREEARRKAAEAKAADVPANIPANPAAQAADAQTRASATSGLPQALPETSPAPATRPVQVASANVPKPAPTAQPEKPATTPIAASKPPAASTPYVLQAGAFKASGDAEAVKAKIALLGLNARVESASINGTTMYRVRMGPYATASELAKAKSKLSGGGLPAVAIKAK